MALSILDGNQSATTLSTILSGGQHITAHTVVSLGTQAITDIVNATSASLTNTQLRASAVTIGGTVTANLGLNELPYIKANINIAYPAFGDTLVSNVFLRRIGQYKYQSISGWANGEDESYVEIELKAIAGFPDAQFIWQASSFGALNNFPDGTFATVFPQNAGSDNGDPFPPTTFTPADGFTGTMTVSYEQPSTQPISGTVTIGSALPAGTNRIGVVTIGAGTVTIGAGTAQIGSVTVGNATTSSAVFVKICGERNGATTNEAREIQTDDDGFLYARLADPSSPSAKAVIYDPVSGNAYVNVRQTASVTIGSLPAISGTVTANGGDFASTPLGAYPSKALRIGYADDEEYNAVGLASGGKPLPVILYSNLQDPLGGTTNGMQPLVISGTVTANSGLNFDVRVTQGGDPVDGDNPFPVSIQNQISGTVTANTFALQGTAVTTSDFTSTTASTVLANYNATREVLTIFNEGAGNLHICAGATCTTIAYQVRLSAGDYYEVPNHQTTITHSAVFATAGTARVTELS
jgi:hypothetical protein